jgi:hypothetical protein
VSENLITPTIEVPQFSPESIDLTVVESEDFRHAQLDLMDEHNPPLKMFMAEKMDGMRVRGAGSQIGGWVTGYVSAHGALRTAVPDELPLPGRDRNQLHGFAMRISRDSFALDRAIKEGYEDHPGMLKFIDRFAEVNQGNTDGLRFMLGTYALWASPTRLELALPRASIPPRSFGPKPSRRDRATDSLWRFGVTK